MSDPSSVLLKRSEFQGYIAWEQLLPPVDRFGRKRQDFAKVALGSEDLVQWEHWGDPVDIVSSRKTALAGINELKKKKGGEFEVIALEQSKKSVDYKKVKTGGKNILVILGNEVEGVSEEILKLADVVAEIPMMGRKESLNVSVAAGVFLFRLLDAD